jgi:hypothetical protein
MFSKAVAMQFFVFMSADLANPLREESSVSSQILIISLRHIFFLARLVSSLSKTKELTQSTHYGPDPRINLRPSHPIIGRR